MTVITDYAVTKYFGHFRQDWRVSASSEMDAWNNAERKGVLQYQQVYKEAFDRDNKGYVMTYKQKIEESKPIDNDQYYKWLKEAADMGMILTPHEYEKCYGLPFHDVWRGEK